MSAFSTVLSIYIIVGAIYYFFVVDHPKLYPDEIPYARTGLRYCRGTFSFSLLETRPRFPGFYVLTWMLFGHVFKPLGLCQLPVFRSLSIVASIANFFLIHKIRQQFMGKCNPRRAALETLVISFCPLLFGYGNVYHPQLLSMTFTLLMFYTAYRRMRIWSSFFALISVLLFQDHIAYVWLLFILAINDSTIRLVLHIEDETRTIRQHYSTDDIRTAIELASTQLHHIPGYVCQMILHHFGYAAVVVTHLVWLAPTMDKESIKWTPIPFQAPLIATFSLFCTVMSPTLLFTYIKKIPGHLRTHLVSLLICSTTAYGLSRVTMMYYPHVKTYPHYRLFLDDDIYERFWFKRSIVVYTTIIAIVHLHTILITTSQLGWQTLLYVCTIGTLGLRTFVNFRDYMVPFLIIRLTAAPPSPKVLMVDLFLYACMATSDFYLGPFRYQAVSM